MNQSAARVNAGKTRLFLYFGDSLDSLVPLNPDSMPFFMKKILFSVVLLNN
jgi:hypothetical protein